MANPIQKAKDLYNQSVPLLNRALQASTFVPRFVGDLSSRFITSGLNQQNINYLRNQPESFKQSNPILSKVGGGVGQFTQNAMDIARQGVVRSLSGAEQFGAGGYGAIRNAFTGQPVAPELIRMGAGTAKSLFGVGGTIGGFSPLGLGLNAASSAGNNPISRLASGALSGMTGTNLDTPSKNVNLLGMEFDPLKIAGSLVGFTKNPTWGAIFPNTSKILNLTKYRGLNLTLKGGTEGLIQGLANLSNNPSVDEIKNVLAREIAFGSVSEVGTDLAISGAKKLAGDLPDRMAKEFSTWIRRNSTMTKGWIGNKYVTAPAWKFKWMEFAESMGIKLGGLQRGAVDLGYKFGEEQATKGGVPEGGVTTQASKGGGETVPTTTGLRTGSTDNAAGGLTGRGSLQPEMPTTKVPEVPQSPNQVPPAGGGGQSSGALPGSINFLPAENKIINALKAAKPARGQQEALYRQVRKQQAGALGGIGEQLGGEAGYYKKLGQLKGELPKVQFESIRNQLTQQDINDLFNKVEQSNLGVFEKVNAQTALGKLLGEGGGSVPTKSELALLNEVFPQEMIQAILDNRSIFQKIFSMGENALNLPRAAMATADLSAPLRQGIFLIGRPKQWIPAFKNMFKYAFNKKAYDGLLDEIKARPTYKLMREGGLSLTDTGPILSSREEAFMSNLMEKIPGFGRVAAGSNRAYSGFLNKLRADVFDDLVKSAKSQGIEVEGKTLKDISSFVNAATGRGDLGALQRAAPILNGVFFSPRLIASRVNLLNPAYYARLDPFVRKEALKSLITFGGTALTVLGLAKLAGAEVGADPRSANFGKIKVGNTRYDVLGGFQQYIRLAAQLITGQIVSSTSGKTMTLGEGYKPLTRKDIIMRFFESKESPVASFVTGLLTGKTGIGEDFNLSEEIISRFIPMFAQDAYDLMKEWGPAGALMAAPGFFGMGSQTYGKTEYVEGKNKIGLPTSQIRPVQDLPSTISEKVFGQRPLGTSASYNVEEYYDQLLKMPREQAAQQFERIAKTNPDLAKKISQVVKDRQKGITVDDKVLKEKGVASGDRAIAIAKEFKKAQTQEAKAKLWEKYVKKGIITKDVAAQLSEMAKRGDL